MTRTTPRSSASQRGGVTLIVVLVLLVVMLFGAFAFARTTEVSALLAGNVAMKDAALQASEVGVNTAFEQVRGLSDENSPAGHWYFPTSGAQTSDGLPAAVDWDAAPSLAVGKFDVRYVAERLCTTTPVVEVQRDCLLRQEPAMQSRKAGAEQLDPPTGRQFRLTVRVTGPRGVSTFVQALATRG